MPRGKGTYGSKVGRPPKKQKKYQTGGEVLGAATMGQELESISLKSTEPDYPIADAMERSETYQLGGAVKPPTAPSITAYKEGGKVPKWKINPEVKMPKDISKKYFKGKEIKSKMPKDISKKYFKGKEAKGK
jgi:hypothetical protein